jgi:hypothetical protein
VLQEAVPVDGLERQTTSRCSPRTACTPQTYTETRIHRGTDTNTYIDSATATEAARRVRAFADHARAVSTQGRRGEIHREKATRPAASTARHEAYESVTLILTSVADSGAILTLSRFLKAQPDTAGEVGPALSCNRSAIWEATGIAFARPVERIDPAHGYPFAVAENAFPCGSETRQHRYQTCAGYCDREGAWRRGRSGQDRARAGRGRAARPQDSPPSISSHSA